MKNPQLHVSYTNKILSSPLTCSADTYNYYMDIWDKELIEIQEQVYVLYLNGCNQVICWRCLNTGTGAATLFDIKLAVAIALNCLASKLMLAHNHPSGSLIPSAADIIVTRRLKQAAGYMDIDLLDHLIVNRKGYYSLNTSNLLSGAPGSFLY